jgi:hypothetical protein
MPRTLAEIVDKLQREDEITLLEILEISSEDLLARFEDRIEEKFNVLDDDLEEEENDD